MNLPWPADAVERRPLTSLKHYGANARTHSPEQVAQIAASIREFGFTIPLLVDEAGELIAGHGRARAAEEIGLELVPVMVARGWTQKQIKAYRLADNQLALNAGWDVKLLAAELETLPDMAALIGFSESELRRLGRLTGNPGLTDPDEAPALPGVPTSKAGDLWLCGQHRILCGDACNAQDVERLLSGVKPNLMVTDPPYGVDYDPHWRAEAGVNNNRKKMGEVVNDERADWRQAYELFPGAVAYVGTPGNTPAKCRRRWRHAAFRSARKSSGPRTASRCRAAIITGSTSRAGTQSGRRATGAATARSRRCGRSRAATTPATATRRRSRSRRCADRCKTIQALDRRSTIRSSGRARR